MTDSRFLFGNFHLKTVKQSVTEEATVGLPLDSALAVWTMVTAVVKMKISQQYSTSEGPKGAWLSTQLWLIAALM